MSELGQLTEHLQELKARVIRIAITMGIITIFVLSFHLEPITLSGVNLYYPTPDPLDNIAAQITKYMKEQLIPEGVQLIQTAPGQAFYAQVYIAALVGLVLSMPVVIREIVGFLKPALKEKEIKIGRTIAIPALCLFITGVVFSYFFVVPYILEFLYQYGESAGLVTFLNVVDFITFVLQFLLAFGVSFQLPLIMYAVSMSGVIDAKFWRGNIRYAVLAIVIFGAVITPDGSGVTMWFIAIPMIALYFAGMIIVERKEKKERKNPNL